MRDKARRLPGNGLRHPGRWLGMAAALFLLCACSTAAPGVASPGFVNPSIAAAYIPLEGSVYLLMEGLGAATVIAPGIAATNAHNANLVDASTVIGVSKTYDLMFFRTARTRVPAQGEPLAGNAVVAYGHAPHDGLREARGPVVWTRAPVLPMCRGCPVQEAFAFEAAGGPGFSGGPVVDLHTGRLVGITFGYRDGPDDAHPAQRLMYAYDLKRVFAELAKIQAAKPH